MSRVVTVLAILSFLLITFSSKVAAATLCEYDGNPFRPGGTCKETVPYVNANIPDYEPTCSPGPEVEMSFESCGLPNTETCPNGSGSCIGAETLIDLSQAKLGGLGPDENSLSIPPDFLAQFYPFMALVDKPLDLTREQPKEAYRTFWRLNTLYQQFDAKGKFFQRFLAGDSAPSATTPPIFDSEIPFYPAGGIAEEDSGSEIRTGEDKYGVNIGYGHVQDSFCELSAGKPTTILVPLGENNISQYANCYSRASRLVVRVMGLSPNQTSAELTAAGARIAGICQGRGNCVIEFGNEVNNKDVEYACPGPAQSCGTTYASQFSAFKAGVKSAGNIPVGAAALDIYNSVYPYQNFLSGAQAAYNNSDVAFANVYCLNTGTCNTEADIATIRAFNGGREPILTEYGLGPQTTSSMKEWVEWAQNNIPSQEVTLLVPNLCPATANGQWIHYKNGTMTDLSGLRFNPTTCGSGINLDELPTFTISELIGKLPDCLRSYPVCADALKTYNTLPEETRLQYDSLMPFVLDNARGYLAVRYYNADQQKDITQILSENLPYVSAVHDALLEPDYGILQTLSPSWVNAARSNLLVGNREIFTPGPAESPSYEVISNTARSSWANDKGVGVNGCRQFDPGPGKASPLTYPQKIFDEGGSDLSLPQIQQGLKVPVRVEQVLDNGVPKVCTTTIDGRPFQATSFRVSYDGNNIRRNENQPLQDDVGRSLVVMNNPKMTDISLAVSETKGDQNFSLTSSFLAKAQQEEFVDTPMFGTGAQHSNNKGETGEPQPLARKDGEAEIDLCKLRNFWLRPAGLQRGSADQCSTQSTALTTTSAADVSVTGPTGETKQHLFEPSCNGQLCYDYIVSQLAAGPQCRGWVLNPYLGIAIALNESGGLVSNLQNGANSKHFGCDPFGRLGIPGYPVSKFQCMVNTLMNDCQAGKTDAQTLSEYGYLPGNNLNTLIDILGGQENCRDGYCFSLIVPPSAAQTAAEHLRNSLPGQRELWARYYSGYIQEFRGE